MPSPFDVDYYLVDQIIPRYRPHIIAGASGAGKTTLCYQLCRDALDGKPWFGHLVQPNITIGYVGADRHSASYVHKFSSMRMKPFPVYSLLDSDAYKPSLVRNNIDRWLEIAWTMGGKPDLLVLDPLSPFLPSKVGDYHGIADTLVAMSKFCIKFSTTILGTYHATKLKQNEGFMRPQDRILGSGALLAFSDTQIFLTDAKEVQIDKESKQSPGYHSILINPHDAPEEEHKLCRAKDTGGFEPWIEVDEYIREQKILKLIPFDPAMRPVREIVTEAVSLGNGQDSTIRRTLKRLEADGFIRTPKYSFLSQLKMS